MNIEYEYEQRNDAQWLNIPTKRETKKKLICQMTFSVKPLNIPALPTNTYKNNEEPLI